MATRGMARHAFHDVLVFGSSVRVIDSLELLEELTDCGLDLRILLLAWLYCTLLLDLLQGVLNRVL
jgi:hypothetical protein